MPHNIWRSLSLTAIISAAFTVLFSLTFTAAQAQVADQALYDQGEKIFKGYCASCHKPDQNMTGPAIKGARERWDGQGDIYAWVKNSQAVIKSGNPYANQLFSEWKKSVMTQNAVTDAEIDAVLYYSDNYVPPVKAVQEVAVANDKGESSAIQWWIIIGLIFMVVIFSTTGVKRSLKNAVRLKDGREPMPEVSSWQGFKNWAWNNKGFASIVGLLLTVFVLVQAWNWAFRIGVYGGDKVEHYKPSQPIAFDHTLHAGNMKINCQYCHSSAEKSKHAGIPSANVCMNCHKAVSEGTKTGTTEISKIYAAVGWDKEKQEYTGKEVPIKWVKVHNLPDHVYFNHQQHVSVGKLECQECHGPIDKEMTVAEQWAPLTMGWCIDCHNTTEVKMAGNGYYDEVSKRLLADEKLGHEELKKYLEDDKITVRELGGWECAKCHY